MKAAFRLFVRRPQIRQGRLPEDGAFAARLAETLMPYGDYRQQLLHWMAYPAVKSYVAELRNSPVGLCLVGFFEDSERGGRYADLLALAVSSHHRRRGVGSALLTAAIAECSSSPGLSELRLSVSEHNLSARALFEKEGFTPRPYELGTYRNGELALRMALCLPNAP